MPYSSPTGPTEYLDDISAPENPERAWGRHTLIDADGCDKAMDDEQAIAGFIAELVTALNLKTLGPLQLVSVRGDSAILHFYDGRKLTSKTRLPNRPDLGRGVSATQIITTSTITFHSDEDGKKIFLDTFICGDYDEATVIDLFKKRFKPKQVGTRCVYRDARPSTDAKPKKQQLEVCSLKCPALLVCPPFTLSNDEPNNPLMRKSDPPINKPKAFDQWKQFYHELTKDALVYVLPHQGDYQDRPYVANIGCALDETFLVSNFKSPPRQGEEHVCCPFVEDLGFTVRTSPYTFEGEADLKWQRDNLYFGGYGIRTDKRSYDQLKDLDVEIVPIKMSDARLYHFDTVFFPLDDERAIVCVDGLAKADVKAIEKHLHILPVPPVHKYDGWTNSVRLGSRIFTAAKSFVPQIERLGFEPVYIDLGEFDKSGADLSCLVCHLNHSQRQGKRYLGAYRRLETMRGRAKAYG